MPSLTRRAVLVCDLGALRKNYLALTERLGAEGAELISVVKANAYGHGAIPVTAALYAAGARRFATADLDEALAIRPLVPDGEVLVLGHTPLSAVPLAAEAGITLTISDAAYAKTVSQFVKGRPLSVQLKLNSGMNRQGLSLLPRELDATCQAVLSVAASPRLRLLGVYSHLATADEGLVPHTALQIRRFRTALSLLAARGLHPPAHLSASAGIGLGGAFGLPLARAGLALYGYAPSPGSSLPPLSPIARLYAAIGEVHTLPRGEAVGYGATYRTRRRETVGVMLLGYADGLPRSVTGACVRVGSERCPIVGRVSMDSATVLLSGVGRRHATHAAVFGEESGDLLALADAAGTIPYEILARLGPRIDRVYQYADNNRDSDIE